MPNFEIKGLENLLADLSKLPDNLARQYSKEALKSAITPLEEAVRNGAPVDHGELRDSVHIEAKAKAGVVVANVVVDAHPFLEVGTHKLPARPFMRPAFDRLAEGIANDTLKKLGDLVEKELKG